MRKTYFYITLGFALFAMFFGAGNLIFPLKLGVAAEQNWAVAMCGFAVTGVFIPLLGFFAMSYYDGNYHSFFAPLGKKAGLISIALILLLLGPGGAVARCLALCYASIHEVFPQVSMLEFSLFASLIVFVFSYRENATVSIIGKFLTPLKLATLGFLIYQGITAPAPALDAPTTSSHFWQGLTEGLETLDLLAAIAFSCYLCPRLKGFATTAQNALTVGAICAILLTAVYVSFCFVAARHASSLPTLQTDLLLITLSEHLIGPWGAKHTMLVILLACLTTVIALSSIFANFMQHELFKARISYSTSLGLTLTLASIVSLLRFDGIVAFLLPIMEVAYPALIVLCLVNITYKVLGPIQVRLPFFATFGATLAYKLLA